MSSSENAKSLSLLAGAAFVAADFGKLVKISAENTVILVSSLTDATAGILGAAPAAQGDVVPVIPLDGSRAKFQAGGDIDPGELLIPATDAQVTAAANLAAVGNDVMAVGIALEAAVAGQIFEGIAMPLTSAASA